jgi:acyl-CoA thioester hydrolase
MISRARIQVRFSDLDILGHVNNAIYFSYLEMARVHYFRELLGADWDWKKYGVVLVKNSIDYHMPVLLHNRIEIEVACTQMGNKSFELNYSVFSEAGKHATGKSVQVCYDALRQQTIEIPMEMRLSLEKIKVS